MLQYTEGSVRTDEVRVPTHAPSRRVDDSTPNCMASRMGVGARLAMLVFGMGPVVGSLIAFGLALQGGYGRLLAIEELAWLSYPVLLPFFAFAAVIIYGALVLNNGRLSTSSKALWLVAIAAAGPIGIPAYWWVHVWRAPHAS